eukprot:9488787-Pyramimonas_sp.AAC.1
MLVGREGGDHSEERGDELRKGDVAAMARQLLARLQERGGTQTRNAAVSKNGLRALPGALGR